MMIMIHDQNINWQFVRMQMHPEKKPFKYLFSPFLTGCLFSVFILKNFVNFLNKNACVRSFRHNVFNDNIKNENLKTD